jgi:putative FmdB family regulatory protein
VPTYAYACTACEHRFEIFQPFTDDSLTTCPQCQGRLRKVFNAVGVVFKGPGFYSNDSRSDSRYRNSNHSTDSSHGSSDSKTTSAASRKSSSSSSDSSSSTSSDSSSGAGATKTATKVATKSRDSAA